MRKKRVNSSGRYFIIFMTVFVAGCAAIGNRPVFKKSIGNIAVPTIEDLVSVSLSHNDLTVVQSLLEADLIVLETLARNSSDNMKLLSITSKLYGYYSFGFVVADEYEDISNEERNERLTRARNLYWRGIHLGIEALNTNRKFKEALSKGVSFKEALRFLNEKDLPAAYSTAFNMGLNLICSLDEPKIIVLSNDYVDLTKWLIETDEFNEYGTAHVLLGVFYAIMPVVNGGGPLKARKEFERAIEISPEFLINHFFYARYYPTLVVDEDTFDREMNFIFSFSMDTFPSARILNEVALKKAKSIHRNRGFYF